MSVLLLRLSGPLQSWGVQSRFGVRDTMREPSKSGVVGLLCAALGRPRAAPTADLAALRMGVRVDCEGGVLRDYHTAGRSGFLRASGAVETAQVILSNRYYLTDARFLVGLEGDDTALLERIHAALRAPRWPLYLGRKACVPGEPVWLRGGLCRHSTLEHALKAYPWLGATGAPPARLRLSLEDWDGPEARADGVPASYAERVFPLRRVRSVFVDAPSTALEEGPCTSLA